MSEVLSPPPGVPAEAWSRIAFPDRERWMIVERSADGEVIGRAFRRSDGSKSFAPGGKRGLIVAWPLSNYAGSAAANPIFVAEGASDTAALLGLGLDAVGVPMAGHAGPLVAELLADRHAVIVADADAAGQCGAAKLSQDMLLRCASVRIITPPDAKDARDAVLRGADAAAFLALADAANPVPVKVAPSAGSPVLVRLSDVRPESVEWLWPGRIALGKLTLLAGDPGLGKSLVTLDLAARVSRGAAWPDASGVATACGGVVLLSAEDGIADTIRPRLDAAGADVSRILALEAVRTSATPEEGASESARAFDLSRDLSALERAIESAPQCRLVVIDPITAYLGGTDSHKNADIRGLLAPLSSIAGRHRIAVVVVTHLNKSRGGPAIYRAMGSLAFAAAARAAWVVSKDKDDPGRRFLLPIKNNIAANTGGLAYRIEATGAGDYPSVVWELGEVNLSADAVLCDERPGGGERTERDDVVEWLSDFLSNGPRSAKDVRREAADAGHSLATVRRAKTLIGVVARKSSFGGCWEWALPIQDAQPPKVLMSKAVSPFGCREHLGESQPAKGDDDRRERSEGAQDAHAADVSVFEGVERLGDTDNGDDWGEL